MTLRPRKELTLKFLATIIFNEDYPENVEREGSDKPEGNRKPSLLKKSAEPEVKQETPAAEGGQRRKGAK
ncbi:CFC_HP_G0102300.mRNA.1.CDS.1 [Saccharomyces cerevisiae]|nr:CFC_HP_G0102300.mRNA.1.CDS.1 [Saccharomyces cerevisiae]CAI6903979.1 CFC_HP_G0102300.mRNA.1.CDS.1 [Saccharomyces cerevisiae]